MRDDVLILKTKQAKGEDGYRTFSVRLKEPLVDRMDELSQKTGQSRNALFGILLEYALDHSRLEDEKYVVQ